MNHVPPQGGLGQPSKDILCSWKFSNPELWVQGCAANLVWEEGEIHLP